MILLKVLKNAKLLIAFGILFIIGSCNNDDEFLILDVSPSDIFKVYNINEPILFFVRAQSSEPNLTNFKFLVREESEANQTILLDSNITGSFFEYNLTFPRPLDKTRKYDFEYSISNNKGKTVRVFRSARLVFDSTSVLLVETSGHRIYPKLTQQPDGFDVLARQALFTDTLLSDTSAIDIYEVADTTVNLTYIWRSQTNGKFVRFNGFDYANATLATLTDAYNAGQKLDQMINLVEDDILLFYSQERNIYAAIRITRIEPGDFDTNGFYEFNLKR